MRLTALQMRARLRALEERQQRRGPCAHRWHYPEFAPARLDYRQAIAALHPDAVAPSEPPPPDTCPSCGATRHRVQVVALPYPDYLETALREEREAQRLLDQIREGATDDH